ncbi:neurotrimin-like [Lycorma delicatula]|uniref:neurotrimin-like n=1 Tax=Lycorma delicatula TaxID=130591 RepID=UPI003F50DB2B
MSSSSYDGAIFKLSCYCNCFSFILLLNGLTMAGDVPSFKSVPTTVKTSEHDTVLLPCYVDNLGANVIRWWKDDTVIWDTSNNSLVVPTNVRMFASNNTLEVSDVSASDTGEYICQVVRPEPWGPLNQIHAIEVQFPPSVSPIPETGELEVALQEEVVMRCTATGVPQPIITWSYEGMPIQLLSNRATLQFKVTDRKMAGEYQCTANNGVGDPTTASILLKVTYPPEVSTDRIWIHTAPGLRADLSCNVNGNPDPKVEWYRDGIIVDDLPRIVPARIHDRHILIIRNVRTGDLGFYTCKAANGIGQGQQVIQLSGVANIAVFKKNIKQPGKYNYTLVWEVDSYSLINEYSLLFRLHELHQPGEWTKLVIPADPYGTGPLHTQSYTLTGLKSSSYYDASILSRNRFGWSRPSPVFRFRTSKADDYGGNDDDDDNDDEDANNNGKADNENGNTNESEVIEKNILKLDEELDRNTIQTVISADFDITYNSDSVTSSAYRRSSRSIIVISITLIFKTYYILS